MSKIRDLLYKFNDLCEEGNAEALGKFLLENRKAFETFVKLGVQAHEVIIDIEDGIIVPDDLKGWLYNHTDPQLRQNG